MSLRRPTALPAAAPARRAPLWLLSAALTACGAGSAKVADSGGSTDDGAAADGGDDGASADCPEADAFPTLTADPANSAYPDPELRVRCEDDLLIVESNGIPAYAYVDMTPNGLEAQAHAWSITRSPAVAAAPTEIPLLGTAAFALNGMPIYGPNEAQVPDPYGDPIYNELVDTCLGHTGAAADYHYHALLVACVLMGLDVSADAPDPIIGYALDGFPIYGPRGCLDADCATPVTFQSGWVQTGDPSTYAWDNHTYVGDSADPTVLDACNGRIGPDGTYRYHATATFPYILGCYAGTPSADAAGAGDGGADGGTGGGADGGAGDPPDCSEVEAGRPCCGDGICDGPETADNCAADCAG
ncbi:MAG: hypothetical protein RL071_1232 [Pseudomonadota bacterium]